MRRNGAFKSTATVRSNDTRVRILDAAAGHQSCIIDEAVDSSKVRDRFRDKFRGNPGIFQISKDE